MSADPRLYPTKVDWWMRLVAGGYIVLALGIPAWHVGTVLNSNAPFDLSLGVFPLVLLAGLWALAYPCRYEIHEKTLVVRSGMVRVRIPLLAVNGARATRTLASAPAWSLDRIAIEYGRGQRVVISPAAKREFLEDLARSAPQLEWDGEELVLGAAWKSAASV